MPEYNCLNCGRPSSSSRKNAMRCSLCRLLNNLMYVGETTKKCMMCKAIFAPIAKLDAFCGDCAPARQNHGRTEACVYCRKEGARIHAEIEVCTRCGRSVKLRPKFLRALRDKIDRVPATEVAQ